MPLAEDYDAQARGQLNTINVDTSKCSHGEVSDSLSLMQFEAVISISEDVVQSGPR